MAVARRATSLGKRCGGGFGGCAGAAARTGLGRGRAGIARERVRCAGAAGAKPGLIADGMVRPPEPGMAGR